MIQLRSGQGVIYGAKPQVKLMLRQVVPVQPSFSTFVSRETLLLIVMFHVKQNKMFRVKHFGGENMEQDFITMIGNVGFPIAITAYLMINISKKLDTLNETIVKLTQVVNTVTNKEV